jgi:LemA protein
MKQNPRPFQPFDRRSTRPQRHRPTGSSRGAIGAGCAVALGLAALAAVVVGWGIASYNGLIGAQETVEQRWAEVENQYKRRYDLIPQLVETVKGAARFEQETLTAVTEARAQVGRALLPEGLPTDPAELERYLSAQQTLSGALGRLFAVAEDYPELRATESFLSLQDQLEGTENRIAVARGDYTQAVLAYNRRVRAFPGNLLAGTFGFEELPQFRAEAQETTAPRVDFRD